MMKAISINWTECPFATHSTILMAIEMPYIAISTPRLTAIEAVRVSRVVVRISPVVVVRRTTGG